MKFKKIKIIATISTILILGMTLFVGCNSSDKSTEKSSSSIVSQESLESEKAEYIENAKKCNYKDVLRNSEEYRGKAVVFTGKIAQISYEDGLAAIHLFVKDEEYGYYNDDMIVAFSDEEKQKDPDAVSRFIEDDVITVYGDMGDPSTYIAPAGNERTIPVMVARYIKLLED